MPSAGPAVAQDQLDATFTALADPTRRAIVARLARGDATVNELAAPFDLTLPGISKHLKVLERCGIISRTRHAQFRPCHLEARALSRPPPGSRTTAGSGRSGSTSSTPTCVISSADRLAIPGGSRRNGPHRRKGGHHRTTGATSE